LICFARTFGVRREQVGGSNRGRDSIQVIVFVVTYAGIGKPREHTQSIHQTSIGFALPILSPIFPKSTTRVEDRIEPTLLRDAPPQFRIYQRCRVFCSLFLKSTDLIVRASLGSTNLFHLDIDLNGVGSQVNGLSTMYWVGNLPICCNSILAGASHID
jgi:hypothetical protein